MNKEIESILKKFIVDGINIPYEFIRYTGDSDTYITYHEISNNPTLSGDDIPISAVRIYDFDIYSKSNYLKIVNELKKVLIKNNFVWIEDSEDMFEEDTCFFHKTITVEKGCELWQE